MMIQLTYGLSATLQQAAQRFTKNETVFFLSGKQDSQTILVQESVSEYSIPPRTKGSQGIHTLHEALDQAHALSYLHEQHLVLLALHQKGHSTIPHIEMLSVFLLGFPCLLIGDKNASKPFRIWTLHEEGGFSELAWTYAPVEQDLERFLFPWNDLDDQNFS